MDFEDWLESEPMATEQVLDYEDAVAVVAAFAARLRQAQLPVETVGLSHVLNRVLATPLIADRDQPPFPRSTRDGFACLAADASQHLLLKVIGQVRAGEAWRLPLGKGEALEIMTGAPVPPGADCVVMVEHVVREGESIRLSQERQIASGENIVPQGAEATAGSMVLPVGSRLRPHEIALAAACGYGELRVFVTPKVAILPTGDELVDVSATPKPHQIRNSNGYSLAAQVQNAHGIALQMAPAEDSLAGLRHSLDSIPPVDLLLLSGGVSMGKYDFVEDALAEKNAEFLFTGVRIQPGKPVVCGTVELRKGVRTSFLALPGNPVSTMVTFSLFVQPVLQALSGTQKSAVRFALATLKRPIQAKPTLTRFLPAYLEGTTEVDVIQWQGSGDIASVTRSNCFLMVPPGRSLERGESVRILLP